MQTDLAHTGAGVSALAVRKAELRPAVVRGLALSKDKARRGAMTDAEREVLFG